MISFASFSFIVLPSPRDRAQEDNHRMLNDNRRLGLTSMGTW